MKRFTFIAIILTLAAQLFAQGRIIIPEPPVDFLPQMVFLQKVDADIQIKEGAATVKLEQTFFNQSPQRLEGTYLFPLGHEAQISDFYLYINGIKTKGQLLDGKQARQTYENIVRSMRDPALLEYSDYNLFKARIFPIEPHQARTIELSYYQILESDNGLFRFTLPIRQSGQGDIQEFQLNLNLENKATLANIYSPSHNISVSRNGNGSAIISFTQSNMEGDKDFILYYSLADQEINSSLVNFRPRTDKDGYFLFMASPDIRLQQKKQIARDFIFVMDVSGSMGGNKIEQARNALHFCLNNLQSQDRFEIISFSSSINSFQNQLKTASAEQLDNARYFVNNFTANGGTNIDGALQRALQLKPQNDERPTAIVFLTDGLPTEGEQNITRILQNVSDAKKDFVRIFSFGVGYDVNTYLLDKLSSDSHGSANYVKPGENIEKEVSAFFSRISAPVLTDIQLAFDGVQVYDMYPAKLNDMFAGQRITVFGRYRQSGKAKVRLSGRQGERKLNFDYSFNLDNRETENEFVAKLWANRKVTQLLEQIRFNGENQELVNSVKSLAMEFGIVTPYTSYLVTEQKEEFARFEAQAVDGIVLPATAQRTMSLQKAREVQAEEDEESVGSSGFFDAFASAPKKASAASGKGAVMSSRIMNKVATSEQSKDMLITIKYISGKMFQLKNGIWQENKIDTSNQNIQKIAFLSTEYFKLANSSSTVKRILALGEKVVFRWENKVYQVE